LGHAAAHVASWNDRRKTNCESRHSGHPGLPEGLSTHFSKKDLTSMGRKNRLAKSSANSLICALTPPFPH
jgi:hypothetical protein